MFELLEMLCFPFWVMILLKLDRVVHLGVVHFCVCVLCFNLKS